MSAAVRDACAGSGIAFEDEGKAQLKGIPGEWEVFEARRSGPVVEPGG